ncbi:hypothetical protein EDB80DRAFT_807912 [Ilyonectria destructans]|nr:hypothetical protein EDB80DRAFT_807912 [Ilyonectria destructans]
MMRRLPLLLLLLLLLLLSSSPVRSRQSTIGWLCTSIRDGVSGKSGAPAPSGASSLRIIEVICALLCTWASQIAQLLPPSNPNPTPTPRATGRALDTLGRHNTHAFINAMQGFSTQGGESSQARPMTGLCTTAKRSKRLDGVADGRTGVAAAALVTSP